MNTTCWSLAGTTALAALLPLSGAAQTPADVATVAAMLEGTIFVVPRTDSVDGALRGCGLEFATLVRDFATRQGAPVKTSGSFYIRELNGGLGYMLKLGMFDDFGPDPVPVAPANAFVRAPLGLAPKKAIRVDSDSPGYALYIGAFDQQLMAAYQSIIENKQMVVGFNRKAGQSDVLMKIDLTVVDTKMVNGEVQRQRSADAVDEFRDCALALIDSIRKK
ncbi:MAG: hypothetical protein V4505_25375 [Pseudomonadota bacterium]